MTPLRTILLLPMILAALSCSKGESIVGTFDQVAGTEDGRPLSLGGYRSTIIFQPDGNLSLTNSEGENHLGRYRLSGKTVHVEMTDSKSDQKMSYDAEFTLENGVLVLRQGKNTATYNRRMGR